MIHEDERRILVEWVKNTPIKSCKAIISKKQTVIGKHFHKNKDEMFYLLKGKGWHRFDGGEWFPFESTLFVPRNTYHEFKLNKGAILLGAGTEPFDINDEIK